MNGPLPLAAIINRIDAITGVRLVGGATDLDAALSTPPRAVPAVHVLCDESGAAPLGSTGRALQPITATVKLVMWVRNAGGAEAVAADMAALETSVRNSLFGWVPAAGCKPLTVRASGNEQAYGSHLIRQLLMTTEYTQSTKVSP